MVSIPSGVSNYPNLNRRTKISVLYPSVKNQMTKETDMLYIWVKILLVFLTNFCLNFAEKFIIKPFENYYSSLLIPYNTNSNVRQIALYLESRDKYSNCIAKDIKINLQHRKYPNIYDIENYTFLWDQTFDMFKFNMPINKELKFAIFYIKYPPQGLWFLNAHIPKEKIRISQKGLKKFCKYILHINHALFVENVAEIFSNTVVYVNLVDSIAYKFYIPLNAQSLTINLYRNQSITILKPYILTLRISNSMDESIGDSTYKTCSFTSVLHNCTLEILELRVKAFVYISIPKLVSLNETLTLTVSTSDANNKMDNLPSSTTKYLERVILTSYYSQGYYLKYGFVPINTLSLSSLTDLTHMVFELEDYADNGLTLSIKIDLQLIPQIYREETLQSQSYINESDYHNSVKTESRYILLVACLGYAHYSRLQWNFNYIKDDLLHCTKYNESMPILTAAFINGDNHNNSSQNENENYLYLNIPQRKTIVNASFVRKGNTLESTLMKKRLNRLLVPYPKTGPYVLSIYRFCFSTSTSIKNGQPSGINLKDSSLKWLNFSECLMDGVDPFLQFDIKTEPCLTDHVPLSVKDEIKPAEYNPDTIDDDKLTNEPKFEPQICGGRRRGICHISTQHRLIITGCKCLAGWEGIGCMNGTNAIPRSKQIFNALILTLSNLAFLPSIVFAASHGLYTESTIYTINMLSSMFYHACDEDVTRFCIASYEVLQYLDFYTSILSMIVTVLALTLLSDKIRFMISFLLAIGLSVVVQRSRQELWTFLTPLLLTTGLMIGTWAYESYKSHKLYPSKAIYVKHIIPGVSLALIGVFIYSFAQTQDNYAYIHSLWHILMASSVYILLTLLKPSYVRVESPTENS